MDRKEYYRQWREKNLERQKQRQREYNRLHADRIKEYHREWRKANAERVRAAAIEYNKINKDHISAQKKAKYLANPEPTKERSHRRYLAKTAEIRDQAKRHYQNNQSAFKRRASERRALLERVTVGDPKSIEAFYEFVRAAKRIRCYWCKRNVQYADRHVDHIIPLSRGGAHAEANLCCACKGCNLRKRAKLPEQFSGQGELSLA